MLQKQNNKLIALTSLKLNTTRGDPQWTFYSHAVITETPTYRCPGLAAGDQLEKFTQPATAGE